MYVPIILDPGCPVGMNVLLERSISVSVTDFWVPICSTYVDSCIYVRQLILAHISRRCHDSWSLSRSVATYVGVGIAIGILPFQGIDYDILFSLRSRWA